MNAKTDFDDMMETFSSLTILSDNVPIIKHGKNSKSEIVEYGINFDSKEELDFYEWILEAKKFGFIESFEYQPPSFILFDGIKNDKNKLIIRPHIYTADFKIKFTNKWSEFAKLHKLKAFSKLFPNDFTVYCDVKGGFSLHGGSREFSINQKWMLSKFSIYVYKIEIPKFFNLAWLPESLILTRKTKKISKRYSGIKTFKNLESSIKH